MCRLALQADFAIDAFANQDHLKRMDQRADISSFSRLQIRDGQPSDAPTICALSDETHRVHRARLPHKFTPDNGYQHWLIARALAQTASPNSGLNALLRVAHDESKTLGYVLLVWDTSLQNQGTVQAVIADIAVMPEAHQQGVALALLKDADAQRARNHWHSLSADVWVDNTASHGLFKKAGFIAERTEYTRGTPPPLQETPNAPQNSNAQWWIIAACLVVGLVVGLAL